MAGNRTGGIKTSKTNKKIYGGDFYKKIGKLGGTKSTRGGFQSDVIGKDGLTGRERAKLAGSKGGSISKRSKAKAKESLNYQEGVTNE